MKLLYVTSLSGKRINSFMQSAIIAARKLDIDFTMACNTDMADKEGYKRDCEEYDINLVHIDFDRNPLSWKNLKARRQLLALMKNVKFDIVHCNTPIGGVLGRTCAHKVGVKHIIYQAHGFHFWKGAPLKNWIQFYPIERWLSRYTEILITITTEDYEAAKKMDAKLCQFVHGVGIDLSKFERRKKDDRNSELRTQLGIPKEAIVLLSVGELNENKNHKIVIRSLAELHDQNVYYVICGEGNLRSFYVSLSDELGLAEHVVLAGFCHNISEYYRMADIFVFPSLREGIPASIMEAMAIGMPVIASDVRGIRDLVSDPRYRFNPSDYHEIANIINRLIRTDTMNNVEENLFTLVNYEFNSVVRELENIYSFCLDRY